MEKEELDWTKQKQNQLAHTWPYIRHKVFETELREYATNWFSMKGVATHPRRSYSLKSQKDWRKNLICADVIEYIEQENEKQVGKRFLHNYVHHGLSSQAMTFNLIGPMIVREDLDPLRDAIQQVGISWPTGKITAEFEYDDRTVFNEVSSQPTCFDVAIFGEDGRIFIESKLRETEFGSCSIFSDGDCDGRNPFMFGLDGCYLHHIGRKYWELMKTFGFKDTNLGSGHICPFVSFYQFYRELLFALKKDGSYILLHDERSSVFERASKNGKRLGLWPFLTESVPAEYSSKIGSLTLQMVVRAIEDSDRHNDWIGEFKTKYGIK